MRREILVISGGRRLSRDEELRARYIIGEALQGVDLLIHGAARGVDQRAAEHAARMQADGAPLIVRAMPPREGEYPTRRNSRMLAAALEEAQTVHSRIRVLALAGQSSRGTWDTYNKAIRLSADQPNMPISVVLVRLWEPAGL